MSEPVELPESVAFLARLERTLERLSAAAERPASARYWVAFSGGVDSTVLLAGLARLVPKGRLRAIHVDHGLHPESAVWAERSLRVAADLGVACETRRVAPLAELGGNLEAAAREARYAALAAFLEPGDVLVTAHHGDDQLETVLLRLLRGTGVRGLAAIHEGAAFGAGYLARPLLDFTRAQIAAQAARWALRWIEDPANRALHYDRSYLRARVLPVLRERWPAAQRSAVGLARRMHEAEQLLEEIARHDAACLADPQRVPCAMLHALGPARQNNLLRHLLRVLDLPMAGAVHLDQLRAAIAAGVESSACVSWPGAQARLYRAHVYLLPTLPAGRASAEPGRLSIDCAWQSVHGRMDLTPTAQSGLPDEWVRAGIEVGFRRGGERFTPAHHAHSKSLKHWFQEMGIVPWMRERIPLLYRNGALIGIADLAISEEARSAPAPGLLWRAVWTQHPPVR